MGAVQPGSYGILEMRKIFRWIPSIFALAVIFFLSSIPSRELPSFGTWDSLVKKGAHSLGYGILALLYWYGLKNNRRRLWLAFILAAIYGLSDEFHQSFIPGRHPSLVDALVFDSGGALFVLWISSWVNRKLEKARVLP
jgi:VanZ family protein